MEVIPGRSVGTKSEDYVETEQEESQQKPKKAELISKISQNKKILQLILTTAKKTINIKYLSNI